MRRMSNHLQNNPEEVSLNGETRATFRQDNVLVLIEESLRAAVPPQTLCLLYA